MEKFQEIRHLLDSKHVIFENRKLKITNKYKSIVNNTSNLYYQDKDVENIIKLNKNMSIDDFKKGYMEENNNLDTYSKNYFIVKELPKYIF